MSFCEGPRLHAACLGNEIKPREVVIDQYGTGSVRDAVTLGRTGDQDICMSGYDIIERIITEPVGQHRSHLSRGRIKKRNRHAPDPDPTLVQNATGNSYASGSRPDLLAGKGAFDLLSRRGRDRDRVIAQIDRGVHYTARGVDTSDRRKLPAKDRRFCNNDRIRRCSRLNIRIDKVLITLQRKAWSRKIYSRIWEFGRC